jgi:2-aminoadipate transaminase
MGGDSNVSGRDSSILEFFAARVDRMRSSEIRELLKLIRRDIISFAGGAPDPITFPQKDQLNEAMEYISQNYMKAFQYGITDGLPSFREELIKFMERNMGIKASLNEVLITLGSQQAIEVLGKVFINKGDKVAVGLPTYIAALQAFNLWRPRYIGVPLDFEGMRVDLLEAVVKKYRNTSKPIKFVYVIPTGQNPTGTIMPLERRKYLLELASKYNFFIIEDDPYGFITFSEDIPPRLKALDTEGRVIYISTFSKIFAPGIRIGWIVATSEVMRYLSLAIQSSTLCPPNLNQYMLEFFLKKRYLDENIIRIRKIYKEKRDAMLESMDLYMPDKVEWTRPVAGFFVFAYLPDYIDTKRLLYYALEHEKVAYVPGRGFYADGSGYNTMRLSYSLPPPDQIRDGIRRLSRVVAKAIRKEIDYRTIEEAAV